MYDDIKVNIQEFTTKTPLQMIGYEAGVCWGANTKDPMKNKKRAWNCIHSQHGRTFEFPDIYMEISGVSARCMREFYTHIGGMPTRLQESTRRVDCSDIEFVNPYYYGDNPKQFMLYQDAMNRILDEYKRMLKGGIPVEIAGNALPLGSYTKVVVKINLRALIEMFHQRLCSKALKEYQYLMRKIVDSLAEYSEEWKELTKLFVPKCDYLGYCPESKSCGRMDKRNG